MANLRGHAVAIKVNVPIIGKVDTGLDHTYVSCSGGFKWPCWGRSAGGKIISTGDGSSNDANCISQSSSHAGIVYGVTGVCHQTANRILYPASLLVSRARGYSISTLTYGTYGVDWPLFLSTRVLSCGQGGDTSSCSNPAPAPSAPRDDRNNAPPGGVRFILSPSNEIKLQKQIKAIYQFKGMSPQDLKKLVVGKNTEMKYIGDELAVTMQLSLGPQFSTKSLKNIKEIQSELFSSRETIVNKLHSEALNGEAFAKEMNKAVNKALKSCSKELQAPAYSQLFGIDTGTDVMLVDPTIAKAVYK